MGGHGCLRSDSGLSGPVWAPRTVELSQLSQKCRKSLLFSGRVLADLPSIVREVVDSEMDTAIHSTRAFWRDTYRDLHEKYFPYKWGKKKGDEYICNFGGYVTENNLAAKYYSGLWSRVCGILGIFVISTSRRAD